MEMEAKTKLTQDGTNKLQQKMTDAKPTNS